MIREGKKTNKNKEATTVKQTEKYSSIFSTVLGSRQSKGETSVRDQFTETWDFCSMD